MNFSHLILTRPIKAKFSTDFKMMITISLLLISIFFMEVTWCNASGTWVQSPGRVIPKTQKMVPGASLHNIWNHKVRIEGKGVAPSPTPWCSSYGKERLGITLDYGRQLYFQCSFEVSEFELRSCYFIHMEIYEPPCTLAADCSRYRRRKWTRRHEFKSSTRLIAFHIALIPLGKVWIQLFSLQLRVNSRTD